MMMQCKRCESYYNGKSSEECPYCNPVKVDDKNYFLGNIIISKNDKNFLVKEDLFKKTTCSMMLSDGEFSAEEILTIDFMYKTIFGEELLEDIDDFIEKESLNQNDFLKYLGEIKDQISLDIKELIIKVCCYVMIADEKILKEEISMLFRIGKNLDMSNDSIKEIANNIIYQEI